MNPAQDFIKRVAGDALAGFDSLMDWLGLAGGKTSGPEYLPINPKRGDHSPGSFTINRNTGAWADFAADAKGGDLVSLVAYLHDCKQLEAAERWAVHRGIALPERPGSRGRAGRTAGEGKAPASLAKPATPPKPAPADDGAVCIMPVPEDAPRPPAAHVRHGKPAHRYAYRDGAGRVNLYHDRYEPQGERKQFAPLTMWRLPAGKLEWRFKAAPRPVPIFGLDLLAARPAARVVVVEGEKAQAAAEALQPAAVVVCWQGGAQAVDKADWRPLAGRDVVLWPDNDEPGGKCMAKLAGTLQAIGAGRVRRVDLAALAKAPGRDDAGAAVLVDGGELAEGDDAADLVARGWTAEHLALVWDRPGFLVDVGQAAKPAAPAAHTSAPADGAHTPAPAPAPVRRFEVTDMGVYLLEPDKSPRFVCSQLNIDALVRDPSNGEWGKLARFKDPDGVEHRQILGDALLSGDGTELERTLRRAGLHVAHNGRAWLKEYLNNAKPAARARVTNRTGWHDGQDGPVFVLPDRAIGQGAEAWLFETETPAANAFRQKGTLEGWRQEVAARCAGNSRLVFAVSMAFASPGLHLVGAESGGFHYRSNSSDGKTTALKVAASVCGGADYVRKYRSTDNAMEGLAVQHCDSLLCLDELAQLDPKAAGEVAYMLANGQGKNRANRTGGIREASWWRLLFLSAGEIGLAQHMSEAGQKARAGQELRLAEIPADAGAGLGVFENLHGAGNGAEFARLLDQAARHQHGTAWLAFLDRLAQHRDTLPATLREAQKTFEARFLTDAASGQARRVATRFALVGAFGEIATDWGVTGWQAGEAMQAAGKCFAAWLGHRGGEGAQEDMVMLAQVREFLQRYGESAFTDWDRPANDTGSHAPVRSDRAGYRRYNEEAGEMEYFIFTEVFKARVCKGHHAPSLGRLLVDRGYAERGSEKGREWLVKVNLPTDGRQRVVHILPTIAGVDDA